MKKKMIFFLIALSAVLIAGGCGKVEVDERYQEYDLAEYVTLGEYKGIEVQKVEPLEISDEAVEEEIIVILQSNPETQALEEGAAVELGDSVTIDYEGKIDGEAFDGGTAEGQTILLGSSGYIDGFDDGLVGAAIGSTLDLNLTFPQDYRNEELAGKPVVFTVTVKSASRQVDAELTDEFVQRVSQESETVDEFRAEVRAYLEEQAAETADQSMKSSAWMTAVENAQILDYPQEEVDSYVEQMTTYYQQYAETYGMEFADVLESMGMTEDTFNEQALAYAQSMVGDELVLYAIVRAEDLSLSQSEYDEGVAAYVEMFGAESQEQLEEYYTVDVLYESLLWDKTLQFLMDNAQVVDQLSQTDDTATDAAVEAAPESAQ